MMNTKHLFALMILCCTQVQGTESHTKTLNQGQIPAKANISQIQWLSGSWQADALGGQAEENWAPASAGSMVGSFKLSIDNAVQFYELMIIREHNQSLLLQLKHFNDDLKGWETQHQTVDFPLIEISKNAAYFAGYTIKKISADEIHVYVKTEPDKELFFLFQRLAK